MSYAQPHYFSFLSPQPQVCIWVSSTADNCLPESHTLLTHSTFPSLEMFFSGETSTQPAPWFRPWGSGRELLQPRGRRDRCGLSPTTGTKQGKASFNDRRSITAARAGQNTPPLPCGLPEAPGLWRQHPMRHGSSCGQPVSPHSPALCNAEGNKHSHLWEYFRKQSQEEHYREQHTSTRGILHHV